MELEEVEGVRSDDELTSIVPGVVPGQVKRGRVGEEEEVEETCMRVRGEGGKREGRKEGRRGGRFSSV